MSPRSSTYITRCGVGVFFLIVASSLSAEPGSTPQLDAGSQRMMKAPDVAFALKAAQGGAAEVQLGQLAVQKASSAEVREFGRQMVDDHTKASDNLKSIAGKESLTLPSSLDARDQAVYTKLQIESGSQFDHDYVKAMVKDHQEDVKEFQKEANKGQDPLIKAFAAQMLPMLQTHLQHIRSIRSASY
jgi:putative membrane protein